MSFNEYWQFTKEEINEDEIPETFLNLFHNSVSLRLRSDVEVASLLSGGIDSSAITLLANKELNGSIKSFSVISDEKKYSEEKFIDILIHDKGIHNEKLKFNSDQVLNYFDEVISCQDEPFASFNVIAQYLIFSLIRKSSNIKVVLSGQGSDELFLGYLRHYYFYLNYLLHQKKIYTLSKEFLGSLINGTNIWQFELSKVKRYYRPFLKNEKKFLQINNDLIKTWNSRDIYLNYIMDFEHASIPILTRYEDRNAMANSIETRLPYLDHRLVEFLINCPIEYKIKNGWSKYLLRKYFNELPGKIRWRRDKKGFVVPEEKWLKSELVNEIKMIFNKSVLDDLGFIDKKLFMEYYNSFLNGNKSIHFSDISRIYIAEKWIRRFVN
jgi:asparagine synthase (glutamine-hydrolysing)